MYSAAEYKRISKEDVLGCVEDYPWQKSWNQDSQRMFIHLFKICRKKKNHRSLIIDKTQNEGHFKWQLSGFEKVENLVVKNMLSPIIFFFSHKFIELNKRFLRLVIP